MRCVESFVWVFNVWGVFNLGDRRLGVVRRIWNYLGGFECDYKNVIFLFGVNSNVFRG